MEKIFSDAMLKSIQDQTVEVRSFADVDLHGVRFLIIAVFEKPEDYPEDCVARIFNASKATNVIIKRRNIAEIRKDITVNFPWMYPIKRSEMDVKSFIEAWV